MSKKNHALETVVPEAVYTDRKELIDCFYDAALKATSRRTMSTVLLGQRRMGKTEIFKRVVNRLFLNQDADDQNTVIPVFYQFPEEHVNRENFSLKYVENFLRWFAAFKLKNQTLLKRPRNINQLIKFIEENIPLTDGLYNAIDLMKAILDKGAILPSQSAIMLPREVAYADDISIVMFLDEFQNTRLPHIDFSIVGFFQEAVESPTCPHFVTGSAMSILADEILGKGALYGRFDYERIESFTDYYGEELVLKAANFYQASIPKTMAP
ncbi:ATPase domain protein, prokaryote domain protein, partial [Candidatus Magnetomorum sp. HK-1]